MHELSLAESMLEIIEAHRREDGFERLEALTLRVGLLAAVDEDALRFAFECLSEEGPFKGARLDVIRTFPTAHCTCSEVFEVMDLVYVCPRCGAAAAPLSGGDELEIISLEVE